MKTNIEISDLEKMSKTDNNFSYLKESLKKLVDDGHLKGTDADTVANSAMKNGPTALSDEDQKIFRTKILEKFFKMTCSECGCDIPPEYWESVVADDIKICPDCLQAQRKRDN